VVLLWQTHKTALWYLGIVLIMTGCRPYTRGVTQPMGIDRLLQNDNQVEIVVKLADAIFAKESHVGFVGLTPAEQTFWCIYWLQAEVDNGGFHQYFFNSAGDCAQDVVRALEVIGAPQTVTLVREAMSIFPSGVAPRDRVQRQEELSEVEDQASEKLDDLDNRFYESPDDLFVLLVQYIREHRGEFSL